MTQRRLIGLLGVLLLLVVVSKLAWSAETDIVLEKVPDGYRITYTLPTVDFRAQPKSGQKVPFFRGGRYLPQPGQPILPVKSFALILPGSQQPEIRILDSRT
ncbi:MAG: hypothetical protein GXO76_12050, partial [Calditrichaeota bacterium]|nr:hypothetical protein [Calditrichota bacterium]